MTTIYSTNPHSNYMKQQPSHAFAGNFHKMDPTQLRIFLHSQHLHIKGMPEGDMKKYWIQRMISAMAEYAQHYIITADIKSYYELYK